MGTRSRLRLRLGIAGLGIAALGAAGLAYVPAQALAAPRQSASSTPRDQPRLDAAAGAARAVAGAGYFTDVAIDTATGRVDVYLDHAPPAVINRLRAVHPGMYVFHNSSAHPQNAVLKLEASISARVSSWTAAGVRIGYLEPMPDGYLKIGVKSHAKRAAARLYAAYGRGWIRVVRDTEPTTFATFRYSDVPGWNGGDFIYHRTSASNWSDCSAGIPVHSTSTGTEYMLTASHCFWSFGGVGTSVRNGYVQLSNNDVYANSSQTLIGSVTKNSNLTSGSTTLDVALIQANTSTVDFDAAWNSQGRAIQIGTSSNTVGDQVCQSGAFDGQICGLVIKALNLTECPGNFCVDDLAQAQSNTSGTVAVGEGDSGGPVYSYSGSNLLAHGMTDQGSGQVTCNSVPTGTSGRACFHTLYFVEMPHINSNWGVAPNT